MTTKMTAAEIHNRAESLPELPTVYAVDMLRAQTWTPGRAARAAIDARADFYTDLGLDRTVHIRVVDVYSGGKIGELIFNA